MKLLIELCSLQTSKKTIDKAQTENPLKAANKVVLTLEQRAALLCHAESEPDSQCP